MTYYKIIAGNGRTYVTTDDVPRMLSVSGDEWARIRTTDGKTVYVNMSNIAVIESMENHVDEPSEIEQIVGATLNGLFGKPKQTETIDLGERIE